MNRWLGAVINVPSTILFLSSFSLCYHSLVKAIRDARRMKKKGGEWIKKRAYFERELRRQGVQGGATRKTQTNLGLIYFGSLLWQNIILDFDDSVATACDCWTWPPTTRRRRNSLCVGGTSRLIRFRFDGERDLILMATNTHHLLNLYIREFLSELICRLNKLRVFNVYRLLFFFHWPRQSSRCNFSCVTGIFVCSWFADFFLCAPSRSFFFW